MKILYFNVIEGNASWGAEWFMNQAFIANKVETIPIDYRKNKFRLASKLLDLKDDFDFTLLQRGENFPLELLASINRPKLFWATELVSRRRDQDRLFQSGLFDHVFVRGTDCIERIVENGWLPREKISILLSSFDQNIYRKIGGIEKDIDVIFVGSLTKRRKMIVEELKKKFNVVVVNAYAGEANNLYNRAKIVLNIHAEDFLDTETRIFEVLGSGALLISEKLSSENPFKNNIHLIEVGNIEEMEEKITFYLQNQTEANTVADSGWKEALRLHTFDHRSKEILEVFKKLNINNKSAKALDENKIREYRQYERLAYLKYLIINPLFRLKRKLKSIVNEK